MKITLKRVEGPNRECGRWTEPYYSWHDAQIMLYAWGRSVGDGYDKVEFRICAEGGESVYSGRFDLEKSGLENGATLREHVARMLPLVGATPAEGAAILELAE